jgi:hypothetical protein
MTPRTAAGALRETIRDLFCRYGGHDTEDRLDVLVSAALDEAARGALVALQQEIEGLTCLPFDESAGGLSVSLYRSAVLALIDALLSEVPQ